MRIGIIGGTFNPIHKAHIKLAQQVMRKLDLNRVIFVPSSITALRNEKEIINPELRYHMVKIATDKYDNFEVSKFEIAKEGISYTIDTLSNFSKKYKGPLYFIAGSDLADELRRWKDFDQILKICNFVIAKRPNYKISDIPKEVKVINVDTPDITSSDIRERIQKGKDFKHLVPKEVYNFIKENNLYKSKIE
jgi:nicotinate-nucleotide adenylyltransferase